MGEIVLGWDGTDWDTNPSVCVLENFLPLAPMVSKSLAKIKVPLPISKN
jgi:hypothetical protein